MNIFFKLHTIKTVRAKATMDVFLSWGCKDKLGFHNQHQTPGLNQGGKAIQNPF